MSVLTEAGCQRTDVYQVVGMDYNQFGNVFVALIDVYIQQIQLHVFSQQAVQVLQVAVVASLSIVDDNKRVFFVVGSGENFFFCPA